jgi:hypothetical protein
MGDAFPMDTTPRFYNGTTPWYPPPNADDSIFHDTVKTAEPPMIRIFTCTLEIGFMTGTTYTINVCTLLKRFFSFALKTDRDFRTQSLQGGDQSIAWPNMTPVTKEGIDLYFQHKIVKYGVRGKINVTMSKSIGQMK